MIFDLMLKKVSYVSQAGDSHLSARVVRRDLESLWLRCESSDSYMLHRDEPLDPCDRLGVGNQSSESTGTSPADRDFC